MLATSARRLTQNKQALARLQNQRRYGGSLSKNKHIENYNNWRGDSEKRFSFDKNFFISMTAWGVIPFTIYYAVSQSERNGRNRRAHLPENFRQ
ncbi:TPA: hypothetical protein N0F65_008512 [Lagenidium giganteum]|uniref:NADH dehydrogenase [ubiquinone] 1 beta subcomplex subunit 4 n=1 Tax=Lagenidium giganteum TaxID=4803 RepID=A0AAV2Z661_9STRA|nr:TPA: hypothetical protein N0F65_008512 [Lagenidium giganteum]